MKRHLAVVNRSERYDWKTEKRAGLLAAYDALTDEQQDLLFLLAEHPKLLDMLESIERQLRTFIEEIEK